MIQFLKNCWRFREQLKRWKKDDWVYTEELLHTALSEMNEYLKPNHPQLETVVDILDRRAGWFYENSNLEGFTQPAFKLIQLEDGSYETVNLLTTEQLKKNQEIRQKQEDYRDSDFKYILDLIYHQHNNWFL